MAILIIEGPARPEFDTMATLPTDSPPVITTKPRRRKRAGKELLAHQAATGMWKLEDEPGTYLPSPETIAAECAAIRSTWSEDEHRLRATLIPDNGTGYRNQFVAGEWRCWLPPGVLRGLRGCP